MSFAALKVYYCVHHRLGERVRVHHSTTNSQSKHAKNVIYHRQLCDKNTRSHNEIDDRLNSYSARVNVVKAELLRMKFVIQLFVVYALVLACMCVEFMASIFNSFIQPAFLQCDDDEPKKKREKIIH